MYSIRTVSFLIIVLGLLTVLSILFPGYEPVSQKVMVDFTCSGQSKRQQIIMHKIETQTKHFK